jgi:transposase
MKPYSQDLRERIIAALETGTDSQPEIAATFGISLSFVEKLWRKWRKTGNCDALPHAGGRERSLKNDESKISAAVAAHPDLTLAELCEQVAAAMRKCGHSHPRTVTSGKLRKFREERTAKALSGTLG